MSNNVSIINDIIGNNIIIFILIVLAINTIRSILAISFPGLLRGTKYEKLIHDRNIDEVAQLAADKALSKAGIGTAEKIRLKVVLPSVIKAEFCFTKRDFLQSLFILIADYIYEFDQEIAYGSETRVISRYYINTMEASLNNDSCSVMVKLLYQLYLKNYDKHPKIDFVLVPKIGNPILAMEFAKKCGAICIIRKGKDDNSRVLSSNKDTLHKILNFEGLKTLQEIAKKSDSDLNGVIIDCNCSGGSSLIQSAGEFNSLISNNLIVRINPIKNAYTLFRADNKLSPQIIDQKFSDSGLNLYRYVDLDEDIKSMLVSLKSQLDQCNHDIYRGEIAQLVTRIKVHATKELLTRQ